MCIDYTNLNKACPKDHYPLSNIDKLVDTIAGHAMVLLVDATLGYDRIMMNLEDEE